MEMLEIVITKLWEFFNQSFDVLGYQISFFSIFIVQIILSIFGYLFYKFTE